MGFSLTQISKAIERDHSTVVNLLYKETAHSVAAVEQVMALTARYKPRSIRREHLLESGIPALHFVEHTEPFRYSPFAVNGEIEVLLKLFIAHAKTFLCLSPNLEECGQRGPKFGVVVGHDFVLPAHYLGVSGNHTLGPRRKGPIVLPALLMTGRGLTIGFFRS
jgi:hypothetical protein